MSDQPTYTAQSLASTLLIHFTEPALVFPDQLLAIQADLDPPAAEPPHAVVLDFSGVGHISSSVWGQLVLLNKRLRETERQLRLCHLNENLQGALDAMRLDQILEVRSTREDALTDLNR